MFQTFAAATSPDTAQPRLAKLRKEMRANGFDGFLVPRADAHQGEYVVARDNRLAWLTSFSGSAGYCAVLSGKAGLFVDGRYTIQAQNEVDTQLFTPLEHPKIKLGSWLVENLPEGGTVAYDPWLYTMGQISALEKQLSGSSITLVKTPNLIDRIWADQPDAPKNPMVQHPLEYAGVNHETKRKEIADILKKDSHDSVVLTAPDSIAWLLNTRGSDLGQTPVALCFAILHADASVSLFIDPDKTDNEVKAHLGSDISLLSPDKFETELGKLEGQIRIDKATAPIAISDILEDANCKIAYAQDPVLYPKACKNQTEIDGAIKAHIRDGVAMAEFLSWLDGLGDKPNISEIEVVEKLESLRRANGKLKNISFDTICGAGEHGAIVHYRVNNNTNRPVNEGDLLLVDSGAQYLDGTTDITRTVVFGKPPTDAIDAFTRVLMGMISLSMLRFPAGLTGRDIDAIARAPLWAAGLDYDHGTGHGVGSYLSVHEGPQGISRRSTATLRAGMIVSNEPGYYRKGAFGIRIENLIYIIAAPERDGADARDMLSFKTLTLAPIDRNLINVKLMTDAQIEWLNAYHQKVFDTLNAQCSPHAQEYLKRACAPL